MSEYNISFWFNDVNRNVMVSNVDLSLSRIPLKTKTIESLEFKNIDNPNNTVQIIFNNPISLNFNENRRKLITKVSINCNTPVNVFEKINAFNKSSSHDINFFTNFELNHHAVYCIENFNCSLPNDIEYTIKELNFMVSFDENFIRRPLVIDSNFCPVCYKVINKNDCYLCIPRSTVDVDGIEIDDTYYQRCKSMGVDSDYFEKDHSKVNTPALSDSLLSMFNSLPLQGQIVNSQQYSNKERTKEFVINGMGVERNTPKLHDKNSDKLFKRVIIDNSKNADWQDSEHQRIVSICKSANFELNSNGLFDLGNNRMNHTRYACNNCHFSLPLSNKVFSVALIGLPGSGKSTFLTTLYGNSFKTIGDFNFIQDTTLPDISNKYHAVNHKILLDGSLIPATKDSVRCPPLYLIVNSNANENFKNYYPSMAFCDISGERIEKFANNISENSAKIYNSNVMLFFIDMSVPIDKQIIELNKIALLFHTHRDGKPYIAHIILSKSDVLTQSDLGNTLDYYMMPSNKSGNGTLHHFNVINQIRKQKINSLLMSTTSKKLSKIYDFARFISKYSINDVDTIFLTTGYLDQNKKYRFNPKYFDEFMQIIAMDLDNFN